MMQPGLRQQRGVALISVLLIFALVVVMAADIASRQYLDIRSTANLLGMRQAEYYAMGGEEWARQMLYRDRDSNARDTLTESWAQEQRFEPDNGEMLVTLVDAQGRYNLNNLVDDNGAIIAEQLALLRRLLVELKLPESHAERIADWLDQDNRAFGSGSEEQARGDYSPANMPMAHPSELRMLGLSEAEYQTLAPHVSTLPKRVRLNVNTLSPSVIRALAVGVGSGDVARITAKQRAGGYTSLNDFQADLGRGVSSDLLTLESEYFQVEVVARFGDYLSRLHSVVQRDRSNNKTRLRIIRREYGTQ